MPAPGTEHWDSVYDRGDVSSLSWHQRESAVSLELIDALGVDPSASVVDVGAGDAPLAEQLLDRGFADVTLLDVAGPALEAARSRLGPRAAEVACVQDDVRSWRPGRRFDLWHDRALLHFFVDADDRAAYVASLRRALTPGGAVVLATFALDGPATCSGLPVARYDADGIAATLGLALVAERREEHTTPAGASSRSRGSRSATVRSGSCSRGRAAGSSASVPPTRTRPRRPAR